MRTKYTIYLTKEERKYVQAVLNSNHIAPTFKKRANVLLMSDSGIGKPESQKIIAARCGVSDVTVYQTIKDFCEKGLIETLSFKKRENPAKPPIVTGEKEARLIALACGIPPEGYSRWTIRLLADKAVELDIFPRISRETIRTVLKKMSLNLT
ncbi:MAG: helix-turn-helix domain-containing protein [Synergistaceae bacterium]|nr:helix-turn-helix domain-containing protein [Synergistaceae bacterium]